MYVGEMISQIVEISGPVAYDRTMVRRGVDEELDKWKRENDGLDSFLRGVTDELLHELPAWARRYVKGCVHRPQLGFATVVIVNPETGRGE